jgi:hypothetical protein
MLGLADREGPPGPTWKSCVLSLRDLLPADEAAPIDTVSLPTRLRGD